jgi:hypothetical protein
MNGSLQLRKKGLVVWRDASAVIANPDFHTIAKVFGRGSVRSVRVPFKNGRPERFYENFSTGFWISGEQRAEVWGRPAAVAVVNQIRTY